MSSNLIIPIFLCCTLSIVQPTEQGILAKLFFDFQGGFLQASLSGGSLILLFLLFRLCLIVRKEVELHGGILLLPLGLLLWNDVVDGDVEPTDQQNRVDDAVVELADSIDDLLGRRRGVSQRNRSMGVFRYTAAIPVGCTAIFFDRKVFFLSNSDTLQT